MRKSVVVLPLLLAFIWPGVGVGQQAEDLVTLTGRQVPYYNLARAFFEGAVGTYRVGDPTYFENYLGNSLGYKPGSPAADAIIAALEAYEELKPSVEDRQSVEAELVALIHDEPAYYARQTAWEKSQAAALGDLFGALRESLEKVGSSMDGIERYIDERIAPTTELVSDKPLDANFFAINDTFEQHAGMKRGEDQ